MGIPAAATHRGDALEPERDTRRLLEPRLGALDHSHRPSSHDGIVQRAPENRSAARELRQVPGQLLVDRERRYRVYAGGARPDRGGGSGFLGQDRSTHATRPRPAACFSGQLSHPCRAELVRRYPYAMDPFQRHRLAEDASHRRMVDGARWTARGGVRPPAAWSIPAAVCRSHPDHGRDPDRAVIPVVEKRATETIRSRGAACCAPTITICAPT